jgi:hypothetical protein
MRQLTLYRALAGGFLAASTTTIALAQSIGPINTWPVGTIYGSVGQTLSPISTIEIAGGNSSLTTGANEYLAFPAVEYFPPNYTSGGYERRFFGSAHLIFTSPTAGKITFDGYNAITPMNVSPPPPPDVTFSNYQATPIGDSTLSVSFTLTIQGCQAKATAIYHHA